MQNEGIQFINSKHENWTVFQMLNLSVLGLFYYINEHGWKL